MTPTKKNGQGHTKGRWKLCSNGECSCLMVSCSDHPIAKIISGEWGDEYPAVRQVGPSLENRYEAYMERIGYGTIDADIAKANARLIAACPTMYEYIVSRANEGDDDAARIIAAI